MFDVWGFSSSNWDPSSSGTVKVVSKESAAGDFGDACHVIGVPVAGGVGDFVPSIVGFFRQAVFEDHEGCHHVGALDVGDVRAFDP